MEPKNVYLVSFFPKENSNAYYVLEAHRNYAAAKSALTRFKQTSPGYQFAIKIEPLVS